MKYWLTTHYPHPDPDYHPWHIYLLRQHKVAVEGISVGNEVFFYEYKHGKPVKYEPEYPTGLQCIVRIAKVSGKMDRRRQVIHYVDGSTREYLWRVPCDTAVREVGFVKRKDLLRVIEYKPRSVLFGFNAGKGVMELCDSQAAALLALFQTTRRPSRS